MSRSGSETVHEDVEDIELPRWSSKTSQERLADTQEYSTLEPSSGSGLPDDGVNGHKDAEKSQQPSGERPKSQAENHDEYPKRPLWHDIALIFLMCMGQIMLQASLSQSLIPLPYIDSTFGVTDPGQESWPTAAFSLTVGTFILPAGRLGDMFGHKTLFIIGLFWYSLWSIICGASAYSGIILFSVARAFQGIGLSLVVPNALAILGREFPDGTKRNLVFSLYGACAPGGFQLGGIFHALFAQFVWWPWTFWVAAIFAVVYAGLAYVVIPSGQGRSSSLSFDWAGCILGVSGLVLFNFAWNQAAGVGWETPYTYALLIVGIVIFALFCYVELNFAKKPLLPLRSLSKATILALGCIAAGWSSFGIWVYYFLSFLMRLRGDTPLLTIAQTCGLSVTGAIAALLTAWLLPRVRPGIIMIMAMLAFCVGQVLLATMPIDQIYWAQAFPAIIITPFGMDFSFPSGTIILSNSMAREDQGVAASLVNVVVNYSISLGLGIAGTITKQLSKGSSAPADILYGYRGAWYFAIGLDLLGVAIAVYFTISHRG